MAEFLLLKKGRFLNLALALFSCFFLVTTGVIGQTVTTDKDDYAPGEYVIITGTGWEAGERVDFTFLETPKPATCVNSHDNFAIADASGNIFYDGFLIKENHLGVHFVLTATGLSSGKTAVTEFTDANITVAASGLPAGTSLQVSYRLGSGSNVPTGSYSKTASFTPPATPPTFVASNNQYIDFIFPDVVVSGVTYSSTTINADGNTVSGPNLRFLMPNGSAKLFTGNYVSVCASPSINAQPSGAAITYGSDAMFSLGSNGPTDRTYQWQVKTSPAGSFTNISGSNYSVNTSTGNLTIAKPGVSMNGFEYRVIISGCTPEQTVSSDGAVLTVNKKALTATSTVASKVYNGSAVTGTVSLGTVSGLVGAETLVIIPSATNYANANANVDKATTISYSLADGTNGGLAANYSMTNFATTGVITKADQTITVTTASPASAVYNTGFTVAATASSGLTVAYSSITPLSNVGANYTMNSGVGIGVVKYNQAGNGNYNAAPEVTVNVSAVKAESTIVATGTTTFIYNGSAQGPSTSDVTGSTGLVTYSYIGTSNGGVAYGPIDIKPSLAGNYSVIATVAADDNYNGKSSEALDFTIGKANQAITWATPSNIVYGTTLSAAQLNATVAVPGTEAHGTITYDPDFGTELAAGDHTLTVNVAGSDNYNAASATVALTVEKADQAITWATPANIVYGTTLSAAQLNATVDVPGTEAHGTITYDPDFGTELAAGDHTLTVNVAGSDNYNAASATVALTVEKANQAITWATPSNIVYGTTLSAAQLNATVAVPGTEAHGTITYDPDFGTELAAGDHTLTVNVAGSDNYNAASATVALTVEKADQAITWATPANIVYGTTLSAAQLNATVDVPGTEAHGTITYDPDFGTELAAGDHTLTVNVAGSDNYNAASATVALTVEKADQAITWATPSNIVYGTTLSAAQLNATVDVPGTEAHGTITYDPDFGTELAAGDHTLTVNVAGSDNYNAASATVALTVEKADQAITWATPSNIVYGTTLSAAQLNATVDVPGTEAHGTITYDPDFGTELAAGGHTLTVNVAGSDNYNAASATVALTVEKADQAITWATPSNIVYGTTLSAAQLNATVDVPGTEAHGTITYDPDFGTELAAGDHTLTVNVAGSDNYNAASATVALTVEKADQAITWATPSNIVYGTTLSAAQLNATVDVPGTEAHGTITYDPDFGTELAAGDHTLTVNVAGSDNYNAASATVALTVEKADQAITWATPANIVYGTTLSAAQLNATVAVPGTEAHGTITYDPDFGTELAAGGHTLTVNVAGSDNYNAASATVALTVEKADQAITWATPSNIVYGTTLSAAQLNATVDVPGTEAHGTITYDPDFGTELAAGDHTLTVNVAGSDNYNAASATVALTVEKADQAITWATPSNIVYGTTLSAAQLNATVAVPGTEAHGTITYDPDFGTELAAGDHTLTVNVAGSDNYNAASATVALTVEKALLTVTAVGNSKFCGQINPALAVSYLGFVYGENESVLDTKPTASTSADVNSTNSSYVIKASGGVDNNYSFIYLDNTLTVKGVTIDASASSNPIRLGTTATLSAQVTPAVAGVSVTFTLSEYNTTNAGTFAQSYTALTGTNGIATVSVASLPSDVYKVTAVAGGGCSRSEAYLPVYDPDGGFVTGGGWIYSQAGNMQGAQSSAEGKANFGFNAKYKTGRNNITEVDGNTNFQFQAGDLHLKSLSHNDMSLVISGAKATYTGEGTINGTGSYEFRLIAVDGDLVGSTTKDKFRIKIWTKGNPSDVVYDNERLASESADATTDIAGGSIVIHKPKSSGKTAEVVEKVSVTASEEAIVEILESMAVAPNPVREEARVRFSLIEDAAVVLRVFDFNGREVERLFSGNVRAHEVKEVSFQRKNLMSGVYILKLTTDRGNSYDKQIIVE